MKLGCVIMASGMSRRFGSNKLLCDFHGAPMMVRILRSIRKAPIQFPVVVTRHPEVVALCKAEGIPVVLHDLPLRSDTVRIGMEYLLDICPDLDGVLFTASDQPLLKGESIAALCRSFQAAPQYIHRLGFGSTVGNPVVFPAYTFQELQQLPPDKGGGAVIKKHPDLVKTTEASSQFELVDADTPDTLQALARL